MGGMARKMTRAKLKKVEKLTEEERRELEKSRDTVDDAVAAYTTAQGIANDANTRFQFYILKLRDKYKLRTGDLIQPETGRITRVGKARAGNTGAGPTAT